MIQMLTSVIGQRGVDAMAFLLAFALTALTDSIFRDKLPHDHGRAFAVNGELSKGKARGSGLIFVLCIALVSLAFLPFTTEYVVYNVLLIASMLSGYLDDAAETAWNEYKKGIIDFVIAVLAGVTYLNFNGCGVHFLQWSFTLPYAVYLLLIVILIWASINVVNCTDGVDGLSASLAVVTIGTYLLAYKTELGTYATAGVVFIGALLAYLWLNAKPSSLLMGDAGSRAMGFFIAMLSLKCGHPFAFLLAAIVFIADGSLGILKISLKRFLHIWILKNTLTPLHDHVRKRKGWSDEQVVARCHEHAVQLQQRSAAGRGRHQAPAVLSGRCRRHQRGAESGLCHRLFHERGGRGTGHHHQPDCVRAAGDRDARPGGGRTAARPAAAGLPRRDAEADFAHRPACRAAKHGVQPFQCGHPVFHQLLRLHGV